MAKIMEVDWPAVPRWQQHVKPIVKKISIKTDGNVEKSKQVFEKMLLYAFSLDATGWSIHLPCALRPFQECKYIFIHIMLSTETEEIYDQDCWGANVLQDHSAVLFISAFKSWCSYFSASMKIWGQPWSALTGTSTDGAADVWCCTTYEAVSGRAISTFIEPGSSGFQ